MKTRKLLDIWGTNGGWVLTALLWAACSTAPNPEPRVRIVRENGHDLSPRLPLLAKVAAAEPVEDDEREYRPLPVLSFTGPRLADPVRQLSTPRPLSAPTAFSFDGLGEGFWGPQGNFQIPNNPSDATADVGPTAIVETVNDALAIFDRSGSVLYGPVPFSQFFQGLFGCGAGSGHSDPVVRYDRLADRWVIAVSVLGGSFCIAVSQTPDPLGAYHRYSIFFGSNPDFPKLAVWPDGYYVTFNRPHLQTCALDRSKMLVGAAMTSQCVKLDGFAYPSDVDGKDAPAPGAPNFLFTASTHSGGWMFHVDWADPSKSALSPWPAIKLATIDMILSLVGQPGTTQLLDPLGGTSIGYRFVYRRFADHESLVFTRNVAVVDSAYVDGRDAVRWGELRLWRGTPYVYQEGTYAPDDGVHRFYPSAAIDQSGDIAVGFSVGSSSLKPGLRFTGRLVNDELGVMTQGEGSIVEGTGVQLAYQGGMPNGRWGDYSMMAVDPLDDCTFWYTGQYVAVDGQRNWRTRIGSFKLPGCGAPPPADDFSIVVSPEAQRFNAGASLVYAVNTSTVAGRPGPIALSIGNLPEGVSASFDPPTVLPGASSKLTLTAASDAMGSLPTVFSAHGRSKGVLHSAPASVQVARNEFAIWLIPKAQEIAPGGTVRFLIQTTVTSGVPEPISLSTETGLQDGFTGTIDPAQITAGERATYTLVASPGLPLGKTTDLGVFATARSDRHNAFATATTAIVAANDFNLQVEPRSVTVSQGEAAQFTITSTLKAGLPETVALAVSGLPAGVTPQLSRPDLMPGESATVTLQTATNASTGPAQVTIAGTSSSASHGATIALDIKAASRPKASGCSSSTSQGSFYFLLIAVAACGIRRSRRVTHRWR